VQIKRKSTAKVQRKWGDEAPTEADMAALDFSVNKSEIRQGLTNGSLKLESLVDQDSLGTRTSDGTYEVKDWDFTTDKGDVDDAIANALKPLDSKTSSSEGTLGALGSFFARLTGSKVLTDSDLKPVLEAMKQHLMKKNVAMEIADKVCEGVGESLVGKKLGSFQSTVYLIIFWSEIILTYLDIIATSNAVRMALSMSLTRILTPKTSTDLLLSIQNKLSAPVTSNQQRTPYSITFVGVNGVGKSTNLSKVCFWLLQNGLRVLIAACDTFRCVGMCSTKLYQVVCLSEFSPFSDPLY
jgi:signal recognition particle receptor subunit alpha